jgi:hypothetical protein
MIRIQSLCPGASQCRLMLLPEEKEEQTSLLLPWIWGVSRGLKYHLLQKGVTPTSTVA